MFLITIFAAFLLGSHAAVLPSIPRLDGRIVGGTPAQITEAPYQASMLLDYWGNGNFAHSCGGIIIFSNVLLTAAHCTDGSRASQWKARVGSTFHNSGGQVIDVVRYVQHPQFNAQLNNDISLLFLANNVILGTGVALAVLPAQGQVVADGSLSLVTGWGVLTEGGTQPTQLYKVTIPIVNQLQCSSAHSSFNPVTENMICAGNIGVGGQDACQGDSGGPLTVAGVLIGITSWGRGCAHPSYPGVWTRVPMYRNWINSNS